nr:plasmid replication initiator TrfA [uncultured Pseudogulbenkiania sp.]
MTKWPELPLPYGLHKNFVTPNALAQSAIFSTQFYRRHVDRPQYFEKTQLAATGGSEIYQTVGQQLDQNDADVFYELIRQVFEQGKEGGREARVRFNRSAMLSALGRAPGGKTRKLLDDSIDRLFAAEFEFVIPDVFTGKSRLILKMHRQESRSDSGCDYDVLLDLELAQLFNKRQWAILKKTERSLLAGDLLAKGLHAYYSTQQTPYPMKPSTLKTLMGREAMQESKWRMALQVSLEKVKQATGWTVCELSSQGATAGKVVVEKATSQKNPSKATSQKNPSSVATRTIKTKPNKITTAPNGDWDDIHTEEELQSLPLERLVKLMDTAARSEWQGFLNGPGPEPTPEDMLFTANWLLMRQWNAIRALRDPSVDPDDDI